MVRFKHSAVIAAVRTDEEFAGALQSGSKMIFDLMPNIQKLPARAVRVHQGGKRLFLHMDLAEGIGKDAAGVAYVKEQGADGIISTRAGMIKLVKEAGMFAVQRFFIIDSQSVFTASEALKNTKADMAEIMPGLLPKVIAQMAAVSTIPVIAGGLIETEEEVQTALNAGASAVSTGKPELWK